MWDSKSRKIFSHIPSITARSEFRFISNCYIRSRIPIKIKAFKLAGFSQLSLKMRYDWVPLQDVIKLPSFWFSQGSVGPPGREGLSGPRGEPVRNFQSLAGLSDSNRRQTLHSIKLTERCGHKVAHKSFLLLSYPINFLILSFCWFFFASQGKPGEPGPSGKAGLPGTPVSNLLPLYIFLKLKLQRAL